ncbi:alpha-amylase family glycosyl hydrolase [Flavobacterium selenitireducens]|uniref:alpha-amylase family glycosyl hydrolase n=1 Tax=Flavobacterium selenitireducens TaxID=2722704 RepID=UPI001CC32AE1|nr:alpha-amylase family glycosyl hydrolase [Flavobacterium selenitireducens]
MKSSVLLIFGLILAMLLCNCDGSGKKLDGDSTKYKPVEYVKVNHPDWAKAATIYEVNIRQYTKEGTFRAFESHLARLKDMGVDIIWLMPIHPIGVEKRKGTLGSEYSVKDYFGVNPEFGSQADFRHLIQKIHEMDMYVIIDWVGNHSAWDNPLAKQHPDWYSKTPEGHFQPTPWYDWDDVIDFDYDNPELRQYMTEALVYWVRDFDIDGYRCDTAGFIPTDFWNNARAELDAVKPVFMLGEWESRDLHEYAFDATYSWSLWNAMTAVTRDGKGIGQLVEYLAHDESTFPRDGYRMLFTDNHDKNSWEGNQIKNFGPALKASMVLCGTINGMPLCYGGQEAGLDRSLKFFDKDEIDWSNLAYAPLYKALFDLKHDNRALWNGNHGGRMIRLYNDKLDKVISFSRTKDGNRVVSIVNYSAEKVSVRLDTKYLKGTYREVFSDKQIVFTGSDALDLKPWGYLVLTTSTN